MFNVNAAEYLMNILTDNATAVDFDDHNDLVCGIKTYDQNLNIPF